MLFDMYLENFHTIHCRVASLCDCHILIAEGLMFFCLKGIKVMSFTLGGAGNVYYISSSEISV